MPLATAAAKTGFTSVAATASTAETVVIFGLEFPGLGLELGVESPKGAVINALLVITGSLTVTVLVIFRGSPTTWGEETVEAFDGTRLPHTCGNDGERL